MDDNRIEVLDSLRAFAALSVCLFHFVWTTANFIKSELVLNIFEIGQFGVHMFFVISGFVIPWAMFHGGYQLKHFFKFSLRRLIRLEPPYLVSIILALLFLFLRETIYGKSNDHIQISVAQVALHVGYLIPFFKEYQWLNPVYWTLAIEFQYYLLMAIIFTLFVGSKLLVRMGIYVLILVGSLYFKEIFIFHWMPIFLLGIIMFLLKINSIQKAEYFIVTSIVLAFCAYKFPLGAILYYSLPILALYLFSNQKVKFLDSLGEISYSIYLIHPIIGAAIVNYLSHFCENSMHKFLAVCIAIIATLLSAWVMYLCIEKPSKKLSASIKY